MCRSRDVIVLAQARTRDLGSIVEVFSYGVQHLCAMMKYLLVYLLPVVAFSHQSWDQVCCKDTACTQGCTIRTSAKIGECKDSHDIYTWVDDSSVQPFGGYVRVKHWELPTFYCQGNPDQLLDHKFLGPQYCFHNLHTGNCYETVDYASDANFTVV